MTPCPVSIVQGTLVDQLLIGLVHLYLRTIASKTAFQCAAQSASEDLTLTVGTVSSIIVVRGMTICLRTALVCNVPVRGLPILTECTELLRDETIEIYYLDAVLLFG
jgi:hypothetical protein